MSCGWYRKNHQIARLGGKRTLRTASAVLLFALAVLPSHAQVERPKSSPPATTAPAPLVDPLGRQTPRRALMGLLKSEERGDFETAARFLQPTRRKGENQIEQAKKLQPLLATFKGNIGLLSDNPNGAAESGLPLSQVRAGVLTAGSLNADLILVQVDDPQSGRIWLVSKETVDSIPKLHAELQREAPTVTDRVAQSGLAGRRLLGMSPAQWLEWLCSFPISWSLAWLLIFLLSVPERIRRKLQKLPPKPVWEVRHGKPLKCILAILMHMGCVYLLGPPLLYRFYYFRFLATLLAACFVWLTITITDRSFELVMNRTRAHDNGGESILILMQRLTRVCLLLIALLIMLALFGVNVKTTLAGLGIGGIAIALAAQKTLENVIGGISLLMDKALRVGDFCRIGVQMGTVEDIGLRSIKLRTLDQNLLVVPNGALAQMEFENMARRSKLLINQTFSLRIETRSEQLRFVVEGVQRLLDQHPGIESGSCRVRVTSFVGAAFELQLFAYGRTGDMSQLTLILQDLILKIAEIVEASGTRFAGPTQLAYLSRDKGVPAAKANQRMDGDTERRVNEVVRFSEARTGTE